MLSGIVGLFLSLIIPAIIQLPLAWVYQSDIVYERITTSGYRGGVAFSTDFYTLAPQLGFSRIPKLVVFFVATIFIFLVLNALLLALNFSLKYLKISTNVSQEQVRSPIASFFKTLAAVRVHPLIMLVLVASISFFVFAKYTPFFKVIQGQKIYRNSEQMLSFIDQKTLALTNPQQMFLLSKNSENPRVLIIGEINLHLGFK